MTKKEYLDYHKTLCDEARLNLETNVNGRSDTIESIPDSSNPRKVVCGVMNRVIEKCNLIKPEVFKEAFTVQWKAPQPIDVDDVVQGCIDRLTLDFNVLDTELKNKKRIDVLKRRCVLIVNTLVKMCCGLDRKQLGEKA